MSLTRATVEVALIARCGKLLTAVGLDGATVDGTNAALTDPIGEGLRLWWELLSKSGLPADEKGQSPHRFLYFPDENHWVLKPQNSVQWHETVNGWLKQYIGN